MLPAPLFRSFDRLICAPLPTASWAAELYSRFPQVKGAAIWYLGPGYGGIADQAQQLIAPLTAYALQNYFSIPKALDEKAFISRAFGGLTEARDRRLE